MFSAAGLMIAIALDALIGDPPRWPHMVRYMGRAVSALDNLFISRLRSPVSLRLAGGFLIILVVGGSGLVSWAALYFCGLLWPPLGGVLGVILAFECLSAGQLWREAKDVARPLKAGDVATARARLSMIVGRETASLDQEGIRRALIETVAENLNDGVVAPIFYMALGGPAAGVAYKAVNTLDSMVGYKNSRYRDLGFLPAKLDDAAGWLPARITACLMVAAAFCLGLRGTDAWGVLLRDRKAHKSPNAGWPEAAMAGALGVRLGGPNRYGGVIVEKPWLNEAGRDPQDADLAPAQKTLWAVNIMAAGLAVLATGFIRGWL